TLYMDVIPSSGTVWVGQYNSETINRKRIPYLRRKIGIVFQDFKMLDDRSILENIMFACRITGKSAKHSKKTALKMLASVGLLDKRNNIPVELSGGEHQRVCIARALVNDPQIILADEPTGNLDPETGCEIFKLLKKINDTGTAVLIATHNYEVVREFPGRVIRIEKGRILPE
ncbi:cell division ATP-binding protein FtsE, partial [candidate division KSB1 bacterium]